MRELTTANGSALGPQDWKRIEALLDVALLLEPGARQAWLDGLSGADRSLADPLRRLLEVSEADTGGFMRHPVGLATLDAVAEDIDGDEAGQLVGGYKLVGKLGVGGMSTVWLARDTVRVLNRMVALKLPRFGWQPGVSERMQQERAILASLEHPGIARLYDAGSGEDGRPFIAMECIDGTPIDKHVRSSALRLPAVIDLVLQVADALAFAHGRLVVHRDIKPSNILVTRDGQAKLLDFGVARLLDNGVAARSELTQSQGRLMTPGYASPEQVAGQSITVASDVYSLGVVLYELLAGVRPYRLARQSAAALEEAILNSDIVPVSRQARADIPWRRELRGDLDCILAKALQRDPALRYGSIAEFADDLRRHLQGVPVRAQPERWSYFARKFIWRHRVGVSMLALLAATLIAGLSAVMWQAGQARQQAELAAAERDNALRELRYAQATEEFIRLVLSEGLSQSRPLSEVLRHGEESILVRYASQPSLRGRLQLALAQLYSELEDPVRRERMIQEARNSAAQAADAELSDAAECVAGGEFFTKGMHERALAVFNERIASIESRADPAKFALQVCLPERSGAHRVMGQYKLAEDDARRALALLDVASPGNYSKIIGLKSQIADALTLAGNMRQAVDEHRKLVDEHFASKAGRSSTGLYITNHYILSLARAGQVAEAYREYSRLLGLLDMKENRIYAPLIHNYARILVSMERFDDAERELKALVGSGGPEKNRSMGLFRWLFPSIIACERQDWAGCLAKIAASEAAVQGKLMDHHSSHATHLWIRAWATARQGDRKTALALVESAMQKYTDAMDRNPLMVRAGILHAEILEQEGRFADAERALAHALADAQQQSKGFEHSEWIARALMARGQYQQRRGWLDDAARVLADAHVHMAASIGPDTAPTQRVGKALKAVREARAARGPDPH